MMPADEHLSEQFFHGTVSNLEPGTVLRGPAHTTWVKPIFPHESSPQHAYATMSESDAWDYAEVAWHARAHGHPRVYGVAPVDPHDVEEDPRFDETGRSRGTQEGDLRSVAGWRVTHEVPMPEHMGVPEEWR